MKIKFLFSIMVFTLWLGITLIPALTSEPHRIASIAITPEGQARLELAGNPHALFKSYFDLFRIESSPDLKEWSHLATVVRTNAATNALAFWDETAAHSDLRFYQTTAEPVLTPFLPPTGPQTVGTFSRMLTDASRTNRFGVRTNSSFMVTFWYPAQAVPGAVRASYNHPLLAERRAYWSSLTNRIPGFLTHAFNNPPPAATPELFPVVIYSHGLGNVDGRGVRTENTAMAQELASHGYVVVSMDHTESYATVLPPDRLIVSGHARSFDYFNGRLKDINFLLNQLTQWNTDDAVFKGRLDLDRIGILGWSYGGGTAAETCKQEDRLKAAVFLDAYLTPAANAMKSGLVKPFLTMTAPGGDTTLFTKATKDAYQLAINGSNHEAFTDNSWIISPSAASRKRAQAMNACMLALFNKYLRGLDAPLLENPSATYPDVTSFKKK